MRARTSPLLLALALALVRAAPAPPAAAPAPPTRPRGLLALRSMCHAQHRHAFDPIRLQAFAADAGHDDLLSSYRFLSFEETCGASWADSLSQSVLATLGAGGHVVSAGWPGARACGLLLAARQHLPACAAPAARAALLAELAVRLRWRRALLWGDAGGAGQCAATQRAVNGAIGSAGVSVARAARAADVSAALDQHPHVLIACASHTKFLPVKYGRTTLLLLHIANTDDASTMSNISLDVGDAPYVPIVDTIEPTTINLPLDETKFSNANLVTNDNKGDLLNATVLTIGNNYKRTSSIKRPDAPTEEIKPMNRALKLLLSDVRLKPPVEFSMTDKYRQLLDAIEIFEPNKTIQAEYYLYENYYNNLKSESWKLVAIFNTTAKLDPNEEDWKITIKNIITNESNIWNRLQVIEEPIEEVKSYIVLWSVLGVICIAALLVATAFVVRLVAARRRGRRRREDAVLSAADFAFPADEARRVPDGMETMLSCWLQQLHEFGGPELERPDLLQPAPPSAPSSTASGSRLALDRRTRYKGDAVQLKMLPMPAGMITVELRRKATDVLLLLHTLRHENLNPFIGCLCETRPSLVFDHCGRGSLEDVLMADEIKLDWTFRLSLLTDLVKGLRYLHASPLRVHGRLSSRNCVVDSRWVLRLTDYGLPEFYCTQGLTPPTRRARDRLWTAPELLRAGEGESARGTQPGDVYSFAIIMQEVIVRGEPYCMLSLSPEEIVEKLCRPPPLIRPSVSMGAAPPEAVSVMRQCWAEAPEMRPSTDALLDIFRLLHRGRKINIVDSMFEMLEKYSNNLEELIKERTEQLDMEKKKTEQLLNRMLPRSVAELLLLGLRVEPEEFEEVSIYFSDIVGFTELAARSSPVQVVALLNDLYTTFDAAIERYRVYKVETIGDAYMVVGGLPVRARDHAESVATMALHLLHLAGRFRIRHLPATPLHLRIGLHSGPCCAGVVGLTMPRYCLFGDTVNTASRMESTGAAWRIQVSSATAARLEAAGGYRLRSRGLTQIKGKGAMHTYWLLGKDGFDKPLPTPPPLPAEEALIEHEAEGEAGEEGDGEGGGGAGPTHALSPAARSDTDAPLLHDKYGTYQYTPILTTQIHDNNKVVGPKAYYVARDRTAWTRSGAVSADSSPPAAPYSRYRCIGGGARVLRRQWSLERGEELAEARASDSPTLAPLALALSAPPVATRPAPPPRYRTRREPDAPHMPTSTSFD